MVTRGGRRGHNKRRAETHFDGDGIVAPLPVPDPAERPFPDDLRQNDLLRVDHQQRLVRGQVSRFHGAFEALAEVHVVVGPSGEGLQRYAHHLLTEGGVGPAVRGQRDIVQHSLVYEGRDVPPRHRLRRWRRCSRRRPPPRTSLPRPAVIIMEGYTGGEDTPEV